MHPPLACTVRGCGRPLTRAGRQLSCDAGHAFDVARSGYVSLLQPQDRRSSEPGDAKEVVAARARLLDAGIGRAAIDAIVEAGLIANRRQAGLPDTARGPRSRRAAPTGGYDGTLVAADLGCGSGELLGTLASGRDVCGVGIDLSAAAAGMAARRFPSLTWIVANADRGLPLLDASVQLITSLNGRRHADECARVLSPEGTLIVAVPAPDDLVELREQVHGEAVARDRADAVVAAHEARFALAERFTVRTRHRLEGETLRDLLRGTYRGARASVAARVETLGTLDITLATEVCVFRRR